jgi:hypothetical protein
MGDNLLEASRNLSGNEKSPRVKAAENVEAFIVSSQPRIDIYISIMCY